MSGSTIGGVVGGAIGWVVGGPAGARWGWMIGSMVGGYVDPEVIKGPRLTDATQQTSVVGIPIPFGYGTYPTTGNVIWTSSLKEKKKKERPGKGGPVQETWHYYRSYAIGICQGVRQDDGTFADVTGILTVKRNGKIVYTTDPNATAAERAASTKFAAKATFYLGGETQMPDATITSLEGAGNVSPFRGLVYMVVNDDDLTELRGAIPQYEFVVSVCGDSTASEPTWIHGDTGTTQSIFDIDTGSGVFMVSGWNDNLRRSTDSGVTWAAVSYTGSTGWSAGTAIGNIWHHADAIWYMAIYNSIAKSLDGGQTWALVTAPRHELKDRSVSEVDGIWWAGALGAGSSRLFQPLSADAGTDIVYGADYGKPSCAAYLGGRYLVGTDAGKILSGTSLASATVVHADASATQIGSFAYLDGVWLANLVTGGYLRSLDGINWTFVSGDSVVDFVVAGGYFYKCTATRIDRGLDGLTWETVDSYFFGNDAGAYMATDGVSLLAATQQGKTAVAGYPVAGEAIPDAPGHYTTTSGVVSGAAHISINRCRPSLSSIVADLCKRDGLTTADYDVSQLTDLVDGYKVATEAGADSLIAPLAAAYFFDPVEHDGKVHFIKRGGSVVAALGPDDYVSRDGRPLEQRRVQEAELLRKVNVITIDPAAGYTPTKQTAERRTSTVDAMGEGTVEVPVVMAAGDAAKLAHKRLKIPWSETEEFKFSLSRKWSKLVPTDVITVTDANATTTRVRLMRVDEESGVIEVEGVKDRQSTYTSDVDGVVYTPPTTTTPGLIGPTQFEAMNLPVLRDEHDELGLYFAISGILSGWHGATLQLSTDGGITAQDVATTAFASTIGYTTTALAAWQSSEYPSPQTVTVYLPDAPESVDYATLLRYNNRAALQLDSGAWEILQYQTVTVNGNNSYTLSGLVRGRYATTPGAAASGASFVLIDQTLLFVRAQQWMLGQALKIRAVGYGVDPDAVPWTDFTFSTSASQTEWPVHGVTATRDGSNNVTVSWIGRARLGVDTNPYHSKYFTGYRVTYSDGQTFDTTDTTHTRSSAPASQTITVAPLNSITGAGPASTGILV